MSANTQTNEAQELFSALADPTRREIIELLAVNGQMPATEIYNEFEVSHPAVSQHLKVLREVDLVLVEKDAQRHLYSLNPKGIGALEAWLRRTTQHWNDRFAKLDNVLESEKKASSKRR